MRVRTGGTHIYTKSHGSCISSAKLGIFYLNSKKNKEKTNKNKVKNLKRKSET